MQKRNLTILIIVLVAMVAIFFGYLFFSSNGTTPTETPQGTNFFSNFSPFGKSTTPAETTSTPPADISGFEPVPEAPVAAVKLNKVSSFPVAGFGIFQKEIFTEVPIVTPPTTETPPAENTPAVKPTPPPTEFVPVVRYVEKATGNIYQTFAGKIEERKFSSIVIPKVYEAYFGNKGETVIMRYLKDDGKTIETFVGALPKEILGADTTGANEAKGSFLPENITDISVAPDTLKIFYLFANGEGAAGITTDLLSDKKSQVFESPFTEWLSVWPNPRMITLTTKPAFGVPGYMYAIDPDRKDLNKILGGLNGLTTLTSPSGKSVLYGRDNLSLNIYSIDAGESNLLGVKTLPEKCVWGKNSDVIYCAVPKFVRQAGYPDAWYQGEVSFSDEIWKIDAQSGNATMISDPPLVQGGEDIDGTKLALDEGENYLFFINKRNSYLWELDLK